MREVPLPLLVLVLALLIASPIHAGTRGATQTRSVEAILATPAGLDDQHVWIVDVPAGASVTVHAAGTTTSTFLLTHHLAGTTEPRTGGRLGPTATLTLAGPASWRVVLDPLAGGPVDVDLLFEGRYGDPDGGPLAEFTLTDVQRGHPCLTNPPGACLP